jgi:hypothetical protein
MRGEIVSQLWGYKEGVINIFGYVQAAGKALS